VCVWSLTIYDIICYEASPLETTLRLTVASKVAAAGTRLQSQNLSWPGVAVGDPVLVTLCFCVPICVCSQCLRRKSCCLPGSGHCLAVPKPHATNQTSGTLSSRRLCNLTCSVLPLHIIKQGNCLDTAAQRSTVSGIPGEYTFWANLQP
jgi:hypothetical protein